MDFVDKIQQISSRMSKNAELIQTEEATKNAIVMPLISALGYDIFDPSEVVPEYTTDIGTKKGEKVDYAIKKDDTVIILIECKALNTDLDKVQAAQLYRYFSVSDARFAVLTNGIEYKFYSDIDEPNKMDNKPFFTFNLAAHDDVQISELKKFTKLSFDLENILNTASELKYTNAIKRYLADQLATPSDTFVKFFAGQVYTSRMTQNAVEYFSKIVREAIQQYIRDRVNDRLKSALNVSETVEVSADTPAVPEPIDAKDTGIVTTDEEIEAYHIVKAIAREVVEAKRITMRDTKSYCGVLLDDNNRKPICRLHFNFSQKYIGLFENKNENKVPIDAIDDIYRYSDQIRKTVAEYAIS